MDFWHLLIHSKTPAFSLKIVGSIITLPRGIVNLDKAAPMGV
jgi:hypothetical protein